MKPNIKRNESGPKKQTTAIRKNKTQFKKRNVCLSKLAGNFPASEGYVSKKPVKRGGRKGGLKNKEKVKRTGYYPC